MPSRRRISLGFSTRSKNFTNAPRVKELESGLTIPLAYRHAFKCPKQARLTGGPDCGMNATVALAIRKHFRLRALDRVVRPDVQVAARSALALESATRRPGSCTFLPNAASCDVPPAPMQHPMTRYDLHSHSTCSDGVLTPSALVQRAAERGVQVLALTDHDEIAGLDEAQAAARESGITLVSGTEVSVTWQGDTIHVVGLRIDGGNPDLDAGLA